MRSINLLPRIPFLKKWFVPLVSGSILLFGMAGTAIFYYHERIQTDIAQQRQTIAELDKQIAVLTSERRLDAGSQTYQALLDEASRLAAAERDWRTIANELVSPLPYYSRLTDLSMKEDKLHATLEFADMKFAAEYALSLQGSSLFDSVAIKSAETVLKPPPGQPAEQTGELTADGTTGETNDSITDGANDSAANGASAAGTPPDQPGGRVQVKLDIALKRAKTSE